MNDWLVVGLVDVVVVVVGVDAVAGTRVILVVEIAVRVLVVVVVAAAGEVVWVACLVHRIEMALETLFEP